MKLPRFIDRRVGNLVGALAILVTAAMPAVFPAFASADTLAARKIELSSSAASAVNQTYNVTFTTSGATRTIVMDFCTDPIVGITCSPPTDFALTGTTATFSSSGGGNIPGGTISTSGVTANHVVIAGTSASSGTGTFVFSLNSIDNPSTVGSFYARIYTYAGTSAWNAADDIGTHLDDGGVAMSTTNSIGVSAAVKETLTFCVAGNTWTPAAACSGANAVAPNITLGHGSPKALDSSQPDTDTVLTELSTNAVSGAVVYMTNSNTACGGLRRVTANATACDIAPASPENAGAAAITAGVAKFGLKISSASTVSGGSPTGTLAALAPYNDASNYGMNWVTGNGTGVGSTYGDPIFNTGGAPVNNNYVTMTFAAGASASTPAGLYSASMNLIATGTF